MDILIFDMDGVLLEAQGYHRALQETVRIVGAQLYNQDFVLTKEQIHEFESVGISSEWLSSVLCLAYLQIKLLSGVTTSTLDLQRLFSLIQDQPIEIPAVDRAISAMRQLCMVHEIEPDGVVSMISEFDNIDRSVTMQCFQQLVLGSDTYQTFYKRPATQKVQSYLKLYDRSLLSTKNAQRIMNWVDSNMVGAAIMTNRPSEGPVGFSGSPEAELGRDLVQLSGIPIIGYGDISWLAESVPIDPGKLIKPNATHALAAIMSSIGLNKQVSLEYSLVTPLQWPEEIKRTLHCTTITVFEDTVAGLVSVRSAVELLQGFGIDVDFRAIGIARDAVKKAALETQNAQVFQDINTALLNIEDFGSVTRN